jgi:hypothetical protein
MKTLIFICLIIGFTSLNAQKGKFFLSSWHENENTETTISSDKYSYFEKGKLNYYFSNDNENIYINMKIEDPGVQNRILKQGLIVWINMDSKTTKKMGIRFPIGSLNSGRRNEPGMPEAKIDADGKIITPLSSAITIELVGFINEEVRRFRADNVDNFRGSVKYGSDGTLHYKMLMPISKLPFRNSKEGNGTMPFTVGIEYGMLPVANGSGSTITPLSSSEPPSGRSRGGSRGGGRSGGGSSGNRNQISDNRGTGSVLSQNTEQPVLLWIKNIKLATDK